MPAAVSAAAAEEAKRLKSKIRAQYKKGRKMREAVAAIMTGLLDRVDLVVSGAEPLPLGVEEPPATTTTTTTTTTAVAREELVEEKVKEGQPRLQQSQQQPSPMQEKTKTEERPMQEQ